MIGFTSYDIPVSMPTTQELLASLTGPQKVGILDSFANRISTLQVKHIYNIRIDVVAFFYGKINEIQTYARRVMRGEVEGITAPTTSGDLYSLVVTEFESDFSEAQIIAVLNKMVDYSKSDGTGDWAWYSSKVII